MASMVKPEVKLKAILEITRNLSTELKIDKVAPRILDSLMELFPQAERLFLILVDPETKRLVRKAFRCRPGQAGQFHVDDPGRRGPGEHQPVDRQPRPGAEEGRAQPGREHGQEPAHQRLDRRPQDPLGDVRAAAHARRPGPGNPPARHQRPQAVPPGRPGRPDRGGRARRRSRSRTPRCTSRSWSASGSTAT